MEKARSAAKRKDRVNEGEAESGAYGGLVKVRSSGGKK